VADVAGQQWRWQWRNGDGTSRAASVDWKQYCSAAGVAAVAKQQRGGGRLGNNDGTSTVAAVKWQQQQGHSTGAGGGSIC